jgi:hypothetical protein
MPGRGRRAAARPAGSPLRVRSGSESLRTSSPGSFHASEFWDLVKGATRREAQVVEAVVGGETDPQSLRAKSHQDLFTQASIGKVLPGMRFGPQRLRVSLAAYDCLLGSGPDSKRRSGWSSSGSPTCASRSGDGKRSVRLLRLRAPFAAALPTTASAFLSRCLFEVDTSADHPARV